MRTEFIISPLTLVFNLFMLILRHTINKAKSNWDLVMNAQIHTFTFIVFLYIFLLHKNKDTDQMFISEHIHIYLYIFWNFYRYLCVSVRVCIFVIFNTFYLFLYIFPLNIHTNCWFGWIVKSDSVLLNLTDRQQQPGFWNIEWIHIYIHSFSHSFIRLVMLNVGNVYFVDDDCVTMSALLVIVVIELVVWLVGWCLVMMMIIILNVM